VKFFVQRVIDHLERDRIERGQNAGGHPECKRCLFNGEGRGTVTEQGQGFIQDCSDDRMLIRTG
jgi:hypothetical protein